MEQYQQRAETRLAVINSVIEESKTEVVRFAESLKIYVKPENNPVVNYENAVHSAPKKEDFAEDHPGWVVAT